MCREVDGEGEEVEGGVDVVLWGESVVSVVEGADGESRWVLGDVWVGDEWVGVETVAEGEGEWVARGVACCC